MNTCSYCLSKAPLFCQKCVNQTLQTKKKKLQQLQKDITLKNKQIQQYINKKFSHQYQHLQLTQQAVYKLKKKFELNQKIKKKRQENRIGKDQIKIGYMTLQKRQNFIQQLKCQEKNVNQNYQELKLILKNLKKDYINLQNKNKKIIESKIKEIQYSCLHQQDKKKIQNLFQIKQSEVEEINEAYSFLNVLDVIKFSYIQLKNSQKFLSFQDIRVINRSSMILLCLIKLFDLWVPHYMGKLSFGIIINNIELISEPYSKIYGFQKLKINPQYINLLQANIQFLERSVNYDQKLFLCFTKIFLKRISEIKNWTGQRQIKKINRQPLQSLIAQKIQKFIFQESVNSYDSCLPPLCPIQSSSSSQKDQKKSNSSNQEYQILI